MQKAQGDHGRREPTGMFSTQALYALGLGKTENTHTHTHTNPTGKKKAHFLQ